MLEIRCGCDGFPSVWQFVLQQKYALYKAGHATCPTMARAWDKKVLSIIETKEIAAEAEVVAALVFEHHAPSDAILIDLLTVAEAHRRKGYAKMLLDELKPYMEVYKATRIEAVVNRDNETMKALCESLGYEPDYLVFSKEF